MILAFNATLNYISVVAWWSNVFLWRKPETHGENLLQIAYKLYRILCLSHNIKNSKTTDILY